MIMKFAVLDIAKGRSCIKKFESIRKAMEFAKSLHKYVAVIKVK